MKYTFLEAILCEPFQLFPRILNYFSSGIYLVLVNVLANKGSGTIWDTRKELTSSYHFSGG